MTHLPLACCSNCSKRSSSEGCLAYSRLDCQAESLTEQHKRACFGLLVGKHEAMKRAILVHSILVVNRPAFALVYDCSRKTCRCSSLFLSYT